MLPMARLIQEIFAPGGTISTAAINAGLTNPMTWIATRNTLVVGLVRHRARRVPGYVDRHRRDADRHSRPQRLRAVLRDAADDRAAGHRTRLAATVRSGKSLSQTARHRAAARQPQPAVFARRHHPSARRAVRAAGLPAGPRRPDENCRANSSKQHAPAALAGSPCCAPSCCR